jgi:hypothetical protein
MIHWLWLLPALLVGASAGLLLCALIVAARDQESIEDLIDRQHGCICEREASCCKWDGAA